MVRLDWDMARARAHRISVLITDCDGVLTDGGVYYGADGESLRKFSVRDGMGVELLRAEGTETAILSGESSRNIAARAEKLRLNHVLLGVKDKGQALETFVKETGKSIDQIAYVGDDVNDLDVMRRLAETGLTASPHDAVPAVRRLVHKVLDARGGEGAFREFADFIVELRRNDERRR